MKKLAFVFFIGLVFSFTSGYSKHWFEQYIKLSTQLERGEYKEVVGQVDRFSKKIKKENNKEGLLCLSLIKARAYALQFDFTKAELESKLTLAQVQSYAFLNNEYEKYVFIETCRFYLEVGRHQEALQLLTQLKKDHPSIFSSQLELTYARVLLNSGYLKMALQKVDSVLQLNTASEPWLKLYQEPVKIIYDFHVLALNTKVEILYQLGDLAIANQVGEETLKYIKDQNVQNGYFVRNTWILKGDVCYVSEKYDEAIEAYLKASEFNNHKSDELVQSELIYKTCNAYSQKGDRLNFVNYRKRLEMLAYKNLGDYNVDEILYYLVLTKFYYNESEFDKTLKYADLLQVEMNKVPVQHRYYLNFEKELFFIYDQLLPSKADSLILPWLDHSVLSYGMKSIYTGKVALLKIQRDIQARQQIDSADYRYIPLFENFVKNELPLNSLTSVDFLLVLEKYYITERKYTKALEAQKQAVAILKQVYGESNLRYLYHYIELIELKLMVGDVQSIRTDLDQAYLWYNNSSETQSYLYKEAGILLAELFSQFGDFDKSKSIGYKIIRNHKYSSILSYKEEALLTFEEAKLYQLIGNSTAALEYSLKSLKQKEKLYSPSNVINFPNHILLSDLYIASGDYVSSEKYLHACKGIIEQNQLQGSYFNADLTFEYVKYYMVIGNYKKASQQLEILKKDFETLFGKDYYKLAEVYNLSVLIQVLKGNQNKEQIKKDFDKANAFLISKLGDQHLLVVDQLYKQAEVYYEMAWFDIANSSINKVVDFWRNNAGKNSVGLIEPLLLKAKIEYANNDIVKSKKDVNEVLSLVEDKYSINHPLYLEAQCLLAKINYVEGDKPTATKLMSITTKAYLSNIQQYFSSFSEQEKNKYWNRVKDEFEFYNLLCVQQANQNPELLKDMYTNIISTKAILLNNSLKMRQDFLNSNDTSDVRVYEEYIELKELYITAAGFTKDELKEQNINLNQIEDQIEEHEKYLSSKSKSFHVSTQKILTWKEVNESLKKNEIAIEVVRIRNFERKFTDSVIYVAIINKEGNKDLTKVILPKGKSLENKWVKYYRNSIIYGLKDSKSYDLFWAPLSTEIASGSTVYLSGDGVYNQINIETLYDNAKSQYVFDQIVVIPVSNTKDIVANAYKVKSNKKSGEEKGKFKNNAWYLYGNPMFYADSLSDVTMTISSLPGAEVEVQKLKVLMEDHSIKPNAYVGHEVKEGLIKEVENAQVFHLATHGYFVPSTKDLNDESLVSNPLLNSGLLLTGAGDILGDEDDQYVNSQEGILTAYEVMNMNFDKTDLVVLSACETGLGEVQMGEGVIGLQRSFLIAGADAIVLSLFKVNDEVTVEFMLTFYELWLKGKDMRVSFNEAKQVIKAKYNAPKLWGAFIMIQGVK